jgi:hypothetical protein
MNYYEFNYDSISAFGDAIALANTLPRAGTNDSSVNSSFDDNPFTLDTAIEAAQNGGYWEKGAEDMAAVNIDIDAPQSTYLPKYVPDVVGAFPNVPAYLAGHPNSMFNRKQIAVPKKFIRVGVGITAPWFVKADALYNKGRAIMAVVNDLVSQGYGVEVCAVYHMGHERKFTTPEAALNAKMTIRVKESHAHWDTGTVAFALANASFFRNLCWRELENVEGLTSVLDESYGYSLDDGGADFDLWFPPMTAHGDERPYKTAEGALNKALEYVADYIAKAA